MSNETYLDFQNTTQVIKPAGESVGDEVSLIEMVINTRNLLVAEVLDATYVQLVDTNVDATYV